MAQGSPDSVDRLQTKPRGERGKPIRLSRRIAGRVRVRGETRFGANLRAARLEAGLSQQGLGSACRLHRTEISLLERGAREPRLGTLVRLARALDVPPARLLEGIE
jgi:DNA-binding XRE family transcriptional regulator